MKNPLSRLLEKRNITLEELSPEEVATVKEWTVRLAKTEVTVSDITDFCKRQVEVILANCDGVTPLTPIQQAALHIYPNIIKSIEGPIAEREALERHLEELINK